MRTVLILHRLRAAKHDPERRSTIYRYVIGIAVIQVGWWFFHFSPIEFSVHFFVALALAVDVAAYPTEMSHQYAAFIIAMTLIVYSFGLWILHDLPFLTGLGKWFYPLTAWIIFVIPFLIQPIGYCVCTIALAYGLVLVFSNCLFKIGTAWNWKSCSSGQAWI